MNKKTGLIAFIFMIAAFLWISPDVTWAADDYEVVWEDQFDGNELNRNIWNVEVNGNGGGNQEHQYYVDSKDNIEVSNGTLKIRALRKSYGGKAYTSGRINTRTKAQFKYGKIEAKMKLPSFQGAWPAFWMLGANYDTVGWPRCGEIDIMEAINTQQFSHGALHWYDGGKRDSGGSSEATVPAGFDRTQWHTYGVEWDSQFMIWTVDGKEFCRDSITDGNKGEFRKEQFIIFNLAIGGEWPGHTIDNNAFPATMEVDYVRVSAKKSDNNTYSGTGLPTHPKEDLTKGAEYKDVLQTGGYWDVYYTKPVVNGTYETLGRSGFIANIAKLGITPRAIRATQADVKVIPGQTYNYSFDIVSDIDKNLTVKMVGEDEEEDTFGVYNIALEKNKVYHFDRNIKVFDDYVGKVNLIILMGGRLGGEFFPSDTSAVIKLTNAKLMGLTTAEVKPEITTEAPTAAPPATTAPTSTVPETTTKTDQITRTTVQITTTTGKPVANKVDITSITGATKTKTKAKISIKKITGAKKYRIQISQTKKFKKVLVTKTVKKVPATIKSAKLKNKKKLYVRVQVMKNINGKNIYGDWSKAKKIKIKK